MIQAVESLLGQSCAAIEVIIIDDASTDGSQEVLRKYANDPRVRLIEHETNRGHIASYNEGLTLTTGRYVGVSAADA